MRKGKAAALAAALLLCLLAALLAFQAEPAFEDLEGHGAVVLPVIMYHSILKDPSRQGPYVLSPCQLEKDLQYLQEKGYESVSVAQLLDYVHDPFASLPEKPVLLTFDDGFYNNYVYAFPLLEQYGMKAVISIIGLHSDGVTGLEPLNPTFDHLGWAQMEEMLDSGRVELGNHSYNLHTIDAKRIASTRRRGESLENYKEVFCQDARKTQALFEEHLGWTTPIYAYPYGLISAESLDFLEEMGYSVSFSCAEGLNTLSKGQSLQLLKRYNRPSGIGSERFFSQILP